MRTPTLKQKRVGVDRDGYVEKGNCWMYGYFLVEGGDQCNGRFVGGELQYVFMASHVSIWFMYSCRLADTACALNVW